MLDLPLQAENAAAVAAASFTIEGSITSSGQTVRHVQYAAPEYVVTMIGSTIVLHSEALGGRFVVDPAERILRPVRISPQHIQIDHLRELIGALSVHQDPAPTELDGYRCRRYRLCNDSGRITVTSEVFCTRVEGLEHTALHAERSFEAQLHPFSLPLDPDEIVVRSTTRTFANGFQHNQEYHLESLVPTIANRAELDEMIGYAVSSG